MHRITAHHQGGAPATEAPASTWRPTVLMGRVSDAVISSPGASRTAIRNTVQGRSQKIGEALVS
jgi:hypothetical protein